MNYLIKTSTLLLILTSILNARTAFGQTSALLSLDVKNVNIQDFVEEIERKSNYHFYYDPQVLDSLRITLQINNKPVSTILNQAFLGSKFQYYIDRNSNIFLTPDRKIDPTLPGASNLDDSTQQMRNPAPALANLNYKAPALSSQNAGEEKKIYQIGTPAQPTATGFSTLMGYVRNLNTAEPIPGALVWVERLNSKAITNNLGFYSISLPNGNHTLTIKAIGLKEDTKKVLIYSDGKLDIDLDDDRVSLNMVTIRQSSANLSNSDMGITKVNIQAIKQIPTVFGEADILKAVLTLPGVKSVGEASGGFNVRGGATDQNLVLFNDATIYNPSHFFGFFSAFNPDVVKDVELYKSSINAKYGGRLSSVLNVNSREGNKKQFSGTAGIGLLTSRLNIEGPIFKDRTSFILGGRTTYSNFIFDLLPDKAKYSQSKASFSDLNLLLNHTFNKKNHIYFTGYLSGDESNLGSDTSYRYSNNNLSLKWRHLFNDRFNATISTGYDGYNYNTSSEVDSITAFNLGFDINQYNLKSGFTFYINPKHIVEFGLNAVYYKLNPGTFKPNSKSSLVIPKVLEQEQALENALYISDSYEISSAISFNAGIRYSHFSNLGPKKAHRYREGQSKTKNNLLDSIFYKKNQVTQTYSAPEFRFSARFALNSSFSIKASYNSLRQYIHMLSNTTSISPTDTWKMSDANIKPQRGQQVSLGFYKNFRTNSIETSIEVYYKKLRDYLDYKSGAQLIMNEYIETDVINTQGKAYGAEFLIKKTTGKLNGWLSYTYSRTLLKMNDPSAGELINRGEYYPANHDKPHDFTFVGNYKISRRLSFSNNLTYSTGRPITVPIGVFNYSGALRALYSDRNSYRIPDYLRVDVSMNIDGNHKVNQIFHSSWTLGVYNLTSRNNAYSTFFTSTGGRINGYRLSIFSSAVPFINYNIRF